MKRTWNQLKTLWNRRKKERELEEELAAHLKMDAQERMESGVPPEEARRAARRDLGSLVRVAEDTRAAWGWTVIEQCIQDLHYGLRNLCSRPMFAIIAVSTLALGIGANTAIFSVLNAALLRPLPYPEPDRLVAVYSVNRSQNTAPSPVAPADFRDWREQSKTLEDLAAYGSTDVLSAWVGDKPEPITSARVTWNFFRTLGVQPMLGQGFQESDEKNPSGLINVMLSHRIWQSRFGGDPAVVGRSIRTVAGSAVIVGVMPPEFRFPAYAEIWTPMGCCGEMTRRNQRYWGAVGRVRSDQSIDAAQQELDAIATRLAAAYPKENQNWSVQVMPLGPALVRDVRQPLWILMGAVAFVIVIACANVAGLALVRSTARRREIAVRLALGATRSRMIRQLFIEGLLVAVAATAGGLLLGRWSIEAFFNLLPQTAWTPLIRFRDSVQMDTAVLLFTVLLSVLTTIVLTLTPMIGSLKLALAESVRKGGPTIQTSRENRIYKVLVVCQFACAIVLLAGAGLLIQSFVRMLNVEYGYDPGGIIVMRFPLRVQNTQTFIDEALQRIKAVPDIEAAALMSSLRFGQLNFPINFEEKPLPGGDVRVRYSAVTSDYFRVLKSRLIAGRVFDAQDSAKGPAVIMINERLARDYFHGENPLGRKIVIGYNNERTSREIIGVVGDIRQDAPGEPVRPEVLVHWPQAPWLAATLVIRSNGDPASIQRLVREAIWSVDKNLPAFSAQTLNEILRSQVATPRLYMILFGVFSAVAVALAALGVYGLFAYIVGRRTSEMAVRLAVGASRSTIVRMVVGEGLWLSLVGVGVGLLGTIALTRVMRSLLFEVNPTDPLTFGAVAIFLLAIALAACYIPARRASKMNPVTALRHE